MPRRGEIVMELRVRYGRVEKKCTHCGKWKGMRADFYVRTHGREIRQMPRSWCKQCENARNSPDALQHGLVAWVDISSFVLEAVRRVGAAEFGRRSSVTHPQLWLYLKGQRPQLRKATAARMMAAAHEVIRSGEVRTREEIHHGNRRRIHEQSDDGPAAVP